MFNINKAETLLHPSIAWVCCYYTAFTIARGFKVKSLYLPLHTVIRSHLHGATQS